MNFTREPIIETVVTPKEGCKLLVRLSARPECEFSVEAVELVSFGKGLFFRSLERNKPFLLSASIYEVIEVKESHMPLKTASVEKPIKIASSKPQVEVSQVQVAPPQPMMEEKESKRSRSKKRRSLEMRKKVEEEKAKAESAGVTEGIESSAGRKLFPPPPTLIKEQLSKYRPVEEEKVEEREETTTFEEKENLEKPSEE